jgi:signal transduction histidine kinase
LKRLRSILAITSVRLSIAYTAIFGVLAIVIVMYMTGSTVGILRRQIQDSVNGEMAGLMTTYEREGINGVLNAMERSAASPSANVYVLTDPAGLIIAANVRELDRSVLNREGWSRAIFEYVPFQGNDDRRFQAVAKVQRLPNGMRLLIGRDLGEPERFRRIVARAWFLSIAATVLLGLATWFLVGRTALKRLDLVSRSTARILSGDRSERLPLSGSNDEFDRLSVRLNEMLDRIHELDDGLRQVSDNIAHDLKTPLTRLRNKAEAALSARAGEARAGRLREMVADIDGIIGTFDALLMISRVESGSAPAMLAPTDLSAVARDVAELYEPVFEEEGFSFEAAIAEGVALRGSRELLARALSNLIDNALKYGVTDGGKKRIELTLSLADGQARLCVADHGPGIAPQDRKKVTERFARLEESRSRPGNGLGLSLVRAVARLHGGQLELEGRADGGTGLRASIVLPVEGGEGT